ncbi:MAG: hypothetical protein QM523_09000 [Candidatus Pacebacteria bacterium]|nr:hypothetical protein [Candidatus Paceibacterota bacterium]
MNIEQTIEAIRVMQAYVDGKEVQYEVPNKEWITTDQPAWNFISYNYRIKPTATLRPWTADEVPLGAWMRFKRNPQDRVLLGWVSVQADRDLWLDEREHSTDGGKTWSACGVVEESK